MVELTPLYDPTNGVMRAAGFMSGSGTNLRKIIEHEIDTKFKQGYSPFHVAVIFTDNIDSNALKIGKEFDLPVVARDKKGFYGKRGISLSDMTVRQEYDAENIKALSIFDCAVAAYAGYMSIASPVLFNAFLGVNVHPADLSIVDEKGRRKYTGGNAVLGALLDGQKLLRSSTHLITNQVDGGPLLMVSAPVPVGYDIPSDESGRKSIANDYQDLLKRKGDWVIFPRTLEDISLGRFAKDSQGNLYYDGIAIPRGVRL